MNHSYLTAILMAAGFILLFVIWILYETGKTKNSFFKRSEMRMESRRSVDMSQGIWIRSLITTNG